MHLGVKCILLLLGASSCLALPHGKSQGQYVAGYTTHVVGVQQPVAAQTQQVTAQVQVPAQVQVAAPALTAQTQVAATTHYVAQPTYAQAPAATYVAQQPALYTTQVQQKTQVEQTHVQVAKQPEVELEKEFHYVAPAQISVRRHKVHVHQPTVHVSQPEIHVSRPEYHVVAPTKYHVEPERPKAQLQDTEYHVHAEPDVEVVKQKVNIYKPDVRVHQKEVKVHHPEVDVVAPTEYELGSRRSRVQHPLEEYHVHAEPDVEVVKQKVNVYKPDVRVHQKRVKVHHPEVDVVAPTEYELGPQRSRVQRPLEEYHVHAEPDVEVVKQKVNVYKPEVRVHQKEVKVHHSAVDVVAPTQYDFGPQRQRVQTNQEYHVVAEPDVEVVKQKVNVYKPEVRVHQQEVKVHSPEYHVVKEPTVEVAEDNAKYYQTGVRFTDDVYEDTAARYVQAPATDYVAQTRAVAGTVFGGKSHGSSTAFAAQAPAVDTYSQQVKTAYTAGAGQPVSFGQTEVFAGSGFSGYHTKSSH